MNKRYSRSCRSREAHGHRSSEVAHSLESVGILAWRSTLRADLIPSLHHHTMSTTEASTLTPGLSANNRDLQKFSCLYCKQRKVRCDRKDPCFTCSKARHECIFRAPPPPRRGKRKRRKSRLIDRLRRYEELLKSHGEEIEPFDLSDSDGLDGGSEGNEMDIVVLDEHLSRKHIVTSPVPKPGRLIVKHGMSRYLDK